ncbi:MAG: aspartate aminotransferase family protein [Pseudomonadota bacterium]
MTSTANSDALRKRALRVLPNGNTRSAVWYDPYPMYVERGSGSRIQDVDGREYLDLANNLGVLIHGHAYPAIVEAVSRQAAAGSCFALPTSSEIELAELLVERVDTFERVRFINTGSEAVALAIKAARAFTGKTRIVKLEGVYHGSYDYAEISNYSTPENWGNAPQAVATVPATPFGVLESVLVTAANDVNMLQQLLIQHDDIAAVIVDPVPPRCGMQPLSAEFIKALRQLTRAAGALLIYDEVIALRFGYHGAQGRYGGEPDLTALGKIIGGGYPVGAVAGRAEVMDATAKAVSSSGTFTANPVTMVAGLACMQTMTRAAYAFLDDLGVRLRSACTQLIEKYEVSMQVAGTGSMFSIYFHKRPISDYRSYFKQPAEVAATQRFHQQMLAGGVLIAPTATCFLSTVITAEDETLFLQAFEHAVQDYAKT